MLKTLSQKVIVLTLIVLGVFGVQVAFAQASVDPAALQTITSAFETTRAATSLHVLHQALIEMTGSQQGFDLNTQQTREYDLVKTEAGWNSQGTGTTSITLPFGAFDLTNETVTVDGVTYIRFTAVPEQLPLDLPTEWTDLAVWLESQTQTQGGQGGQGGFGGLGGGLLNGGAADDLLTSLMLPLSADSVTNIAELPGDTLDGQAMQVYQVTFDSAAVLESDASGLFNLGQGGGFAGGQGGNLPGGQGGLPGGGNLPGGNLTPPADLPALPDGATPPDASQMQPVQPENVQITLAVYIGETDGFVHRIYAVINVASTGEGDSATAAITATTISDFSAFNAPVEIVAPM